MAAGPYRLPSGGAWINRQRVVNFTFDGKALLGFEGDTLASALLANGIRLVGRSFKYHRPRGILTAGSVEPNALVAIGQGGRLEPNTRATTLELYDGLAARSQNRWPSLRFDALGLANGLLSPVLGAGFYYKTFKWPRSFWERLYEPAIRRAAGLGRAASEADSDTYETANDTADVLIVGGSAAGRAAVQSALAAGARVILCDENPRLDGQLEQHPRLRLLTRTTAVGFYDHGIAALVERVTDHLAVPEAHLPRQRLWTVRTKSIVLATGTLAEPLVFPGNDRPGVMLAREAGIYLERFGVAVGQRVVVLTRDDAGHRTADRLREAGIKVPLVVDRRNGGDIEEVAGSRAITGAVVDGELIPCDAILMSGGATPVIHLASQRGIRPVFDPELDTFRLPSMSGPIFVAGTADGRDDAARDGEIVGAQAAAFAGFGTARGERPPVNAEQAGGPVAPKGKGKMAFVDFQNDVTAADVALAAREGYWSVEHLKRYTTLGMATDQGKTANVNGLKLLAESLGRPVAEVGTTVFRPPYVPVALATFAGRRTGAHFLPAKRSALHAAHEAEGAVFTRSSDWWRPHYFPQGGETFEAAVQREAIHVRKSVGVFDVSTLGKFIVEGPDAAIFLERVYANCIANLKIGRARYAMMLREDGMVFDDGTVARLGDQRFYVTTSTDGAPKVARHLTHLHEACWPHLRLAIIEVTDAWCGVLVTGPRARELMSSLFGSGVDFSTAALPFMGVLKAGLPGIGTVQIIRVSFTGELGYELHAANRTMPGLYAALLAGGAPFGLVPFGIEALDILRIEKGFLTSGEIDGRVTLDDIGHGGFARPEGGYVGAVLSKRHALVAFGRPQLVGFQPVDTAAPLTIGAQIVAESKFRPPLVSLGHVVSAGISPHHRRAIGLGFLNGGRARMGERFYAADPVGGTHIAVEVVDPCFIDRKGARLRD